MRPEEDKDIKVFHPSNEKKEQAEESTDLSRIYCTPYRSLTPSAQTAISAAHASSAGVSRSSRPKTQRSSAG